MMALKLYCKPQVLGLKAASVFPQSTAWTWHKDYDLNTHQPKRGKAKLL